MALKDIQTQFFTQQGATPPVIGGAAAFALGSSLKVIGISALGVPTLEATVVTVSSSANDTLATDTNNLAYVMGRRTPDTDSRLEIFDVSVRSAPAQLASLAAASSNDGYRMFRVGTTLWVAVDDTSTTDEPDTLRGFDVSTPAAPSLTATYDLLLDFPVAQPDMSQLIGADGGNVVVIASDLVGGCRIGIYDVSVPLAVSQESTTDLVGAGQPALAINYPLLYVYQGAPTSTISIYDITNAAAPLLLGSVGGLGISLFMSHFPDNGFLYLNAISPLDTGIRVVDVSVPAAPVLIGSVAPSGVVNRNSSVVATNQRLIVFNRAIAGGPMKAQVYDASNAGAGVLTLLGEVNYNVLVVIPNSPWALN